MTSPVSSAICGSVPMIRWVTVGSIDIVATRRRLS